MAIGPSDTLLGQKRRDVPATFETNPVLSGPPGQGPAAPIGAGPKPASPIAAPARPAAAGSPGRSPGLPSVGGMEPSGGGFWDRARKANQNVAGALTPDPGLSMTARGAALGDAVSRRFSGDAQTAKGAVTGAVNAVSTAVEPVADFGRGLLGGAAAVEAERARGAANSTTGAILRGVVPALAQGTRMVLSEAGVNPGALVRNTLQSLSGGSGPAPNPAAAAQSQAQPQAQTPANAAQQTQPAAPQTPAPPALAAPAGGQRMGTFVGSDGVVRQIPDGDLQAPGRAVPAAPAAAAGALQAPALPQMQVPQMSTTRADPARTRAGDEATKRVMQEIESQLFRNSFAAGRGSRSARALQGQLTQSLAGLAPTLGASADAADARNVQARTALAQTQAQQAAAQLQAQAGVSANDRRAQAAELVAQIGAGARPPTLITGEQGAYTIGPNGQAVPVLAPDGSQVRPSGGGGQTVKPDTLFKQFTTQQQAIQSDPTMSPEQKQAALSALFNSPLYQGVPQALGLTQENAARYQAWVQQQTGSQ